MTSSLWEELVDSTECDTIREANIIGDGNGEFQFLILEEPDDEDYDEDDDDDCENDYEEDEDEYNEDNSDEDEDDDEDDDDRSDFIVVNAVTNPNYAGQQVTIAEEDIIIHDVNNVVTLYRLNSSPTKNNKLINDWLGAFINPPFLQGLKQRVFYVEDNENEYKKGDILICNNAGNLEFALVGDSQLRFENPRKIVVLGKIDTTTGYLGSRLDKVKELKDFISSHDLKYRVTVNL